MNSTEYYIAFAHVPYCTCHVPYCTAHVPYCATVYRIVPAMYRVVPAVYCVSVAVVTRELLSNYRHGGGCCCRGCNIRQRHFNLLSGYQLLRQAGPLLL